MICITQGHEKSISIEVFLKSVLQLTEHDTEKLLFFVEKKSLVSNLDDLGWKFEIKDHFLIIANKKIKCEFIENNKTPSTSSLIHAIKYLEKNRGILFTLPTSKDQLFLNEKQVNGHTELFRNYFNDETISMVFSGPVMKALLITDHISLNKVSSAITPDMITSKVKNTLSFFDEIDTVVFSGINPHSGENGLMGNEEEVIKQAISSLKVKGIRFLGPLSGDTLHRQNNQKTLMVYMAHDQGLAPFKLANSLYGSNISLGLPFLRFSPDHGTAFELYGKNKASEVGCLYSLKEALLAHG